MEHLKWYGDPTNWFIAIGAATFLVAGFVVMSDGGGPPEDETCAERVQRQSREQGVPLMYNPNTGEVMGCP